MKQLDGVKFTEAVVKHLLQIKTLADAIATVTTAGDCKSGDIDHSLLFSRLIIIVQ